MTSRRSRSLRRGPEQQEVTPLELFFDLVYVFAIGQLSAHLLENLTWTGLAETVVLYVAVYAAWAHTAWASTLTDPRQPSVQVMVLLGMLLGLFMNASIPSAFSGWGWLFVTTYLLLQIGRTLWLLTAGLDPVMQRHLQRTLVWLMASAPLWIAGAALEHNARLILWGIATAIDLAGVLAAHPLPGKRIHSENVAFVAEHYFERTRLFFMIALGETILTTGLAISHAPLEPLTMFAGTVALIGTITLWWVYFRRSEPVARREVYYAADPVKVSRYAMYGLMVLVAGLLVIAVGDELVIANPAQPTDLTTNALLFGGPMLFFAAQSWYMRVVLGELPPSRPAAIIALVALGVATLPLPHYAAAVAATAVVLAVAVADGRRAAREESESPK
ncbi:low temperature requirement protein A [Prescottella agglutinans]|uniref:Low temperature requirement protein LtrA n=1 Tax=Prescottella agglutinans TaxID=1644129 RepID=A0ABT6MDW5_9NOCA|nr:low temperature requirement protein A [Prescottella agglutinans]MDH6282513.1 low temperature requirement protein LtrA [Prescottella agglutinans]